MMTAEQKAEARRLWDRGELSASEIAKAIGITKNTIIGMAHRGSWVRRGPYQRVPTTLFERCDALHARLDAVLRATKGVGRIANIS